MNMVLCYNSMCSCTLQMIIQIVIGLAVHPLLWRPQRVLFYYVPINSSPNVARHTVSSACDNRLFSVLTVPVEIGENGNF